MKTSYLKLIIISSFILSLFSTNHSFSQSGPFLSNYIYNHQYINPAYSGTLHQADVSVTTRQQWTAFEGSPSTYFFSGHSPIPTANRKLAVGAMVIKDILGSENNTYYSFDLAYQLRLKSNILSFGIRSGGTSYKSGVSDLTRTEFEDQTLQENIQSSTLQFGAGVYLYDDDYFLSLSIPQLVKHYVTDDNFIPRNYYLGGGYTFDLNENLRFKTSGFMQITEETPVDVSIAPSLLINKMVWLGVHFRSSLQSGVMTNIAITEKFRVGYLFEFPLNTVSNIDILGTHEFTIGYSFGEKKAVDDRGKAW